MFNNFDKRPADRLFLTRDATENGISEWELRKSGHSDQIIHGVRSSRRNRSLRAVPAWADEEWDSTSRMLRALLIKYPHIAASHASAGILHGLPIPRRVNDGNLHVATDDPNLRIRRRGIVAHRVTDFSRVNVLGHQLIAGPTLFLQLAGQLDVRNLVRIGDAMIGRWQGPPLCSLDQLQSHFSSRRIVKNRATVKSALTLIRPDVDSPMETDLRLWLISAGLPEPEIHPVVHCRLFNASIRPDLGYPAAKLALEYEGEQHRTDQQQWRTDISRVNALVQEGWLVLRVTSGADFQALEAQIRERLREAGYRLSSDSGHL